MKNEDYIEIEFPKPGDYVGAKFRISGWVDLAWFENENKLAYWWQVGARYLALDAKIFMGGSISFELIDTEMKGSRVKFSALCELTSTNIPFIQKSHGRIVVEIESPNEKTPSIYLPVIVKQFEDEYTMDPDITKKHLEVGETVLRYQQEIKIYHEEMAKLYESRKAKDTGKNYEHLNGEGAMMAYEIFKILEEDEETFDGYTYAEEDRREEYLKEKYKDAIKWMGPFATGIISQFGGFELRVYSDDHDQHFHVIHRGKGIDARFSFPDMQLMNYKSSKTTISSKAEKKIREHCLQPEILKKFKEEFSKRKR